jgi:hypothetical protein
MIRQTIYPAQLDICAEYRYISVSTSVFNPSNFSGPSGAIAADVKIHSDSPYPPAVRLNQPLGSLASHLEEVNSPVVFRCRHDNRRKVAFLGAVSISRLAPPPQPFRALDILQVVQFDLLCVHRRKAARWRNLFAFSPVYGYRPMLADVLLYVAGAMLSNRGYFNPLYRIHVVTALKAAAVNHR